jgi:hypothetical protein
MNNFGTSRQLPGHQSHGAALLCAHACNTYAHHPVARKCCLYSIQHTALKGVLYAARNKYNNAPMLRKVSINVHVLVARNTSPLGRNNRQRHSTHSIYAYKAAQTTATCETQQKLLSCEQHQKSRLEHQAEKCAVHEHALQPQYESRQAAAPADIGGVAALTKDATMQRFHWLLVGMQ